LTGPVTASSGEAIVVAFRGRPQTRSFGEPTDGVPTANDTFPLSDGALLVLTVAVDSEKFLQSPGFFKTTCSHFPLADVVLAFD
jgi:hypothetical protein